MRIAVAGSGQLGANLAKHLLGSHHEVVAVLENGRNVRGLRRRLGPVFSRLAGTGNALVQLAVLHRIPVYWIAQMTDAELAPLRTLELDLVLVGGFSIIIKAPLLSLPRVGCVNVHSSLLPKHRGPNPFTAVLLADESETGVTFHVMDEGIDTGAILDQASFPISSTDTARTIYAKCAGLAGRRVVGVMDRIEDEGLCGTPQDEAAATYDKKLKEDDLFIRWDQPAADVARMVRACVPFLLPRFTYRGRTIYVSNATFDATPVDAKPGTVLATRPKLKVASGEGAVTVTLAHSWPPFPCPWPMPRDRPRAGEKAS